MAVEKVRRYRAERSTSISIATARVLVVHDAWVQIKPEPKRVVMFQTLDRLERLLEIATNEGIVVRCEWLGGVRGGLVRIGKSPILFVDESLSVPEQFEQSKNALGQLDWSESEWWDQMSQLLEMRAV